MHDKNKEIFALHRIILKKSGSHLPRIELEEMGPFLDFEVRRSHLALAEDLKRACRQPKVNKVMCVSALPVSCSHFSLFILVQVKKTKNVSHDVFGTKLGRVHMQRQEFSRLQTRKIKGLKRSKDTDKQGPNRKKQRVGID